MAGPWPDATRSQPANVIVQGDDAYLVDVGVASSAALPGYDVEVAEMMDPPEAIANSLRLYPDLSEATQERLIPHLVRRHLSPREVGEMATNSRVGKVVITHTSPVTDPAEIERYEQEVRAYFEGEVVLANDLDRF